MTWEWSHSQEAYDNLRLQLEAQDREFLETVYAEWKAEGRPGWFGSDGRHAITTAGFDERRYQRALCAAKDLSTDVLVEKIYNLAERQASCTNGGWEAWTCPYGCAVHMLPFEHPRQLEIVLDVSEGIERRIKCKLKGDHLSFWQHMPEERLWRRFGRGLWNDHMKVITDDPLEREGTSLTSKEKIAFEDALIEELESMGDAA